MRIRTKDSRLTVPWTANHEAYKRSSCSDSSPLLWTQFAFDSGSMQIGEYRSMSDVVTPGYYSKVRRGEVFFNPATIASLKVDPGTGSSNSEVVKTVPSCTGSLAFYERHRHTHTGLTIGRFRSGFGFSIAPNGEIVLPVPIVDISSLITEAATACLAERGNPSDSNLFESLAEANSTLGTLSSLLQNLSQLLSKNSSLITRAKGASGGYLLWRYGISPIMNDIQSIVDKLGKQFNRRMRVTARGTASSSATSTLTKSGNHWGSQNYDGTITTNETATLRAMSLDEYYVSLSSAMGFSSKNLITLPWELTGYSFVADWFLNIGDFLAAITPVFGLNQLGSCYVTHVVRTETFSITGATAASGYTIVNSIAGSSCTRTFDYKVRTLGLPTPGITIRGDFRLTNLNRCLDAIALIVQRLR